MAQALASVERIGAVLGWQARAYRRVWYATITTSFLNPVFFLLAIGVLLGGIVEDAKLGGLSYLEFVAPGLLAVVAMQIGTNESTYPVMAGIRWLRTYHAVVATPVHVAELFLGTLGWVAVRAFAAAVVFAAVAAVGGAFSSPLALVAPFAAVLCGLAFAAPVNAFSATIGQDGLVAILNRFVIMPMFLFSGTFFPVSQLPDWLEPVAWATPLWHGVELCRDLATGRAELLVSLGHAAYLFAWLAAGAVLAVIFLRRKLLS